MQVRNIKWAITSINHGTIHNFKSNNGELLEAVRSFDYLKKVCQFHDCGEMEPEQESYRSYYYYYHNEPDFYDSDFCIETYKSPSWLNNTETEDEFWEHE